MGEKSFYDLDYIIQINEDRLEQYTTAYQKVLERLTHIILVYSGISIFLIPLIQDGALYKIKYVFFTFALFVFLLLLLVSLIFTIRLILPVQIAYLSEPRKYYKEYRLEYEKYYQDQDQIKNLLKASYIKELQIALETNQLLFRRKGAFYYNALVYGLLSIIPFLICLGFHVSFQEDKIQKVHIVKTEINRNFNMSDLKLMSNLNDKTTTKNTTSKFTELPGIVDEQVIPSEPDLIKENSQYVSNKKDKHKTAKIKKKQ
jgi:hypothetical protein